MCFSASQIFLLSNITQHKNPGSVISIHIKEKNGLQRGEGVICPKLLTGGSYIPQPKSPNTLQNSNLQEEIPWLRQDSLMFSSPWGTAKSMSFKT
jgi:hypothetical protein